MKKWITFVLVFVMAFIFIGCKTEDNGNDQEDNTTKASGVEISSNKSVISVNEVIELKATVIPDRAKQEVIWSSIDESIAIVDQTGKVTGKSEGTTTIVATTVENNRVKGEKIITVQSTTTSVEPTSLTIDGKNQVTINSNITLTASVLPINASQEVIWTSNKPEIATVVDGKVTGKQIGEVTITASVKEKPEITATHQVSVIDEVIIIIPTKPDTIVISGEEQMTVGSSINLLAAVLPAGVNQNVIWTSLNTNIATVSSSGEVTAIKEGTVYIKAISVVEESVYEIKKIIVKIPSTIPNAPDLGGYQIKIMAAGQALHEHDPFKTEYTALDKTAKQKAWLEVEKRFNCDLVVVPYPDIAPWGPQRYEWINQNASLGTAEMDIFVSTTEWLKVLADGGSIVDTSTFYQIYGKNQLPNAMKGASTYKGGLYALPFADAGSLHVETGIFYNIALLQRLGLESPAKLFNEDKWTYTDFYNYVNNAKGLITEGQFIVSGEPSLYWAGMVNAGGVKIMDTVTLSINVDHPYSRQAISTLKKIVDTGAWDPVTDWDAKVLSFNEGRSLFQAGELWFVRSSNRWPNYLWDEGGNSRFGYVPFPYPDTMTKNDTRVLGTGGACYMMAANRQYGVGVTAEYIYWAFTEMMLNTAKYMKDDPTYSEDGVMRLAAQAKVDDPNSVEAIVFFKKDKVVFDPVDAIEPFYTSGSIGVQIRNAVLNGTDFAEATDGAIVRLQSKLLEIYG